MKAVIVGLGQFGRAAALAFVRLGAETVAIDRDLEAVKKVQDEVDLAVCTDAADIENLAAQGVEEADFLVAAIGGNFEAQILTVVHAKKLGVAHVLARSMSPSHGRALLAVGADEVLDPERDGAEALVLRIMTRQDGTQLKLAGTICSIEMSAPAGLVGRPLRPVTLDLLELQGVHLVAILRRSDQGETTTVVAPNELLRAGDRLLLVGPAPNLALLAEKS